MIVATDAQFGWTSIGLHFGLVLVLLAPSPLYAASQKALCDLYAADPKDPDKPKNLAGVEVLSTNDAALMVKVCEAAVKETHFEARYLYQLARTIERRDMEYTGNAIPAYEKAAQAGSSAAMVALGNIYLSSDFARAKGWFEKAAAKGNGPAMHNLGNIFANGLGVAVNRALAKQWYEKAALLGNLNSAEILKSGRF